MLETGNRNYYYFDIDKISDWILNNPLDKKFTEATYAYDHNGTINNTVKHEIELTGQQSAMRADLIGDMLNTLYNSGAESEGNEIKFIKDLESLSIGNKMIINTFIENEFILDKINLKK